jgi:hypothetical protein
MTKLNLINVCVSLYIPFSEFHLTWYEHVKARESKFSSKKSLLEWLVEWLVSVFLEVQLKAEVPRHDREIGRSCIKTRGSWKPPVDLRVVVPITLPL